MAKALIRCDALENTHPALAESKSTVADPAIKNAKSKPILSAKDKRSRSSLTQIIQNLISLISASIPLTIAVITFFNNLTDKTTRALDLPSLRVLEIERQPITKGKWRNITIRIGIETLIVIIMLIISLVIILIFVELLNIIYAFYYFHNVYAIIINIYYSLFSALFC